MQIYKQTFFHVSDKINWQKDEIHFVGKDLSSRYQDIMMRGFMISKTNGEQIPLNAIVEGMNQFLQTQQKVPFMPENYHYNTSQTLQEVLPMIRTQLTLIREMMFEEVRKEHFPNKLSRYKALHVIPADKEALSFWLPQLKTPSAKIYKLELTGRLHRGHYELLNANSVPAEFIKLNAYQYWLGTNGQESVNDECVFEGMLKILEVVDAGAVAAK